MKKNFFSILLIFVLISSSVTVLAKQEKSPLHIISQDEVDIDGITVLFTLYNDNGVMVETSTIVEDDNGEKDDILASKEFNEKLLNIVSQRAEQRPTHFIEEYSPKNDSYSNSEISISIGLLMLATAFIIFMIYKGIYTIK